MLLQKLLKRATIENIDLRRWLLLSLSLSLYGAHYFYTEVLLIVTSWKTVEIYYHSVHFPECDPKCMMKIRAQMMIHKIYLYIE